jgi:hypothetical protein
MFYNENRKIANQTDAEVFGEAHIYASQKITDEFAFKGQIYIDESGVKVDGRWNKKAEKLYLEVLQQYCEEIGDTDIKILSQDNSNPETLFVYAKDAEDAKFFALEDYLTRADNSGKVIRCNTIHSSEYVDFKVKRAFGWFIFEVVIEND